MTIVFLFIAALSSDALNDAIAQMKSAAAQKGKCSITTQIKAARMHLELMLEAKDFIGPEGMASGIAELEQEAKTGCAAAVNALSATVTILKGGTPDPPDDDKELAPEPPVTPPKMPEPKGSPFTVPQDLKGTLDALVRVLGPSWKQVGIKDANLPRMDWSVQLEADKCYAFIGVGAPSVKRVALYLFDGLGKRRAAQKGREVSTTMFVCPFVTGTYQLQTKVKRPGNGYIIAAYVRE